MFYEKRTQKYVLLVCTSALFTVQRSVSAFDFESSTPYTLSILHEIMYFDDGLEVQWLKN